MPSVCVCVYLLFESEIVTHVFTDVAFPEECGDVAVDSFG